jgi:hypothetical protein
MKKVMRDGQLEVEPISGHVSVAQQPIDALDAVLGTTRARKVSAD